MTQGWVLNLLFCFLFFLYRYKISSYCLYLQNECSLQHFCDHFMKHCESVARHMLMLMMLFVPCKGGYLVWMPPRWSHLGRCVEQILSPVLIHSFFLVNWSDAEGFEIPSLEANRPVAPTLKERSESKESFRPAFQRVWIYLCFYLPLCERTSSSFSFV
jgi:hypothetical protein